VRLFVPETGIGRRDCRSSFPSVHIPAVPLPLELIALAASQQGVVSREQARRAGLNKAAIRSRLESGVLEIAGSHVLRFTGHPPSWRQQLTAGLLDLGPDAVVAMRAAAPLLGLDGFPEGPAAFLVPRSHRRRRTVGDVHSVARLPAIDRVVIDGLPATSGARTVVDLAAVCTERELEGAVDSALRLGWTSERFLRKRLSELRHRGRDGVRLLDRVLDGAGGHSHLERQFLTLMRRHGIVRPATQTIYRAGGRFVARTDFTFPPPHRLIVEVAGHATHATRRQRQRDAQRLSELQLLGFTVLPFTYEDVMERPEWVAQIVTRALAQAFQAPGWSSGSQFGA